MAGKILPKMTVREILRDFPQTRDVFDRYGLSGCGGADGPLEPVSFFAKVHQVDEEKFLRELNESANGASAQTVQTPVSESLLYKRFLKTALLFLILGSSIGLFGMFLMILFVSLGLTSAFPWGIWWGRAVAVHAPVQLFGFAGLFVMGVAYHVVPRFLMTELHRENWARLSFYFQAAGVALIVLFLPFSKIMGVAGGIFLAAGVLFFILVITGTVKQSSKSPAIHTDFLKYGSLWFLIGALFYLSFSVFSLFETSDLSSVLQAACIHVMLFGFICLFIFGVSLRTLHLFMGLKEPDDNKSKQILVLMNVSLISFCVQSFLENSSPLKPPLLFVSTVLLLLACVLMVMNLHIFSKPAVDLTHAPISREYERYIRGAFFWLILGAFLFAVSQVLAIFNGEDLPQTFLVSSRHALTIGFVAQMIFGVASRIVPIFGGVELKSNRILNTCFYILNAGVILRVGFQFLSGYSGMSLYPGVAVSGMLHFFTFLFLAYNLWATMDARVFDESPVPPDKDETKGITKDSIVWNVLNDYPQTLAVFLKFGFAPLKNPVLRNTLARAITIEKACKMHGVNLEKLVAELSETAGLRCCEDSVVPARSSGTVTMEV